MKIKELLKKLKQLTKRIGCKHDVVDITYRVSQGAYKQVRGRKYKLRYDIYMVIFCHECGKKLSTEKIKKSIHPLEARQFLNQINYAFTDNE